MASKTSSSAGLVLGENSTVLLPDIAKVEANNNVINTQVAKIFLNIFYNYYF